jgi:hypothetical protein
LIYARAASLRWRDHFLRPGGSHGREHHYTKRASASARRSAGVEYAMKINYMPMMTDQAGGNAGWTVS